MGLMVILIMVHNGGLMVILIGDSNDDNDM